MPDTKRTANADPLGEALRAGAERADDPDVRGWLAALAGGEAAEGGGPRTEAPRLDRAAKLSG